MVLYQLLTGKLPRRFEDRDPEAVGREVRREPTVPSVAVLADQPEARAAVLHTVGRVHRNLGIYDQATQLLQQALATHETIGEARPAELVRILTDLGMDHLDQGEFDVSERVLDRALEVGRTELGESHPDTAPAMHWRGFLAYRQGELDEAIDLLRSSLDVLDHVYGEDSLDSAIPLMMLADVLMETGEYSEAEGRPRARPHSATRTALGPGRSTGTGGHASMDRGVPCQDWGRPRTAPPAYLLRLYFTTMVLNSWPSGPGAYISKTWWLSSMMRRTDRTFALVPLM